MKSEGIRALDIKQALVAHTVAQSGYDTHRDYIGLSQLHKCSVEIWNAYWEGNSANLQQKLLCYKGYQMEHDLCNRLSAIYPEGFEVGAVRTIMAYDGLVQGHPDGYLHGYPLDIKTVDDERFIPTNLRTMPYRVRLQMQAYLFFLPASFGYVVYESRDTGAIEVFTIPVDRYLQLQITEKVVELVNAVKEQRLPDCGCQKCTSARSLRHEAGVVK